MPDPFKSLSPGLSSPFENAINVTPDDVTDLPAVTRALRFVGTVRVITAGGQSTILSAPEMTTLPVRVSRVLATGTTGSNIVALW